MRIHILLQGFLAIATIAGAVAQEKRDIPNYKNAKLSAKVRVQDLLSRMTLEEKVGQLQTTMKEHQVSHMYKNGIGNMASV